MPYEKNIQTKLTDFEEAIVKGNYDKVKKLIVNVDNLNTNNFFNKGYAPLHLAIINGSYNLIPLLLDNGADINHTFVKTDKNQKKETINALMLALLLFAFESGYKKEIYNSIVEQLLDYDDDKLNTPGYKPLDPNYVTPEQGNSCMHFAVFANKPNILKRLKNKGFNVNLQNNLGEAPLHLAALGNAEKSIEYLLDVNADITCKTKAGRSLIYYALSVETNTKATKTILSYCEKFSYFHPLFIITEEQGYEQLENMFFNAVYNGDADFLNYVTEKNLILEDKEQTKLLGIDFSALMALVSSVDSFYAFMKNRGFGDIALSYDSISHKNGKNLFHLLAEFLPQHKAFNIQKKISAKNPETVDDLLKCINELKQDPYIAKLSFDPNIIYLNQVPEDSNSNKMLYYNFSYVTNILFYLEFDPDGNLVDFDKKISNLNRTIDLLKYESLDEKKQTDNIFRHNDINKIDATKKTPLCYAINCPLQIVEGFIKGGANVNALDLQYALKYAEQTDVINFLVDNFNNVKSEQDVLEINKMIDGYTVLDIFYQQDRDDFIYNEVDLESKLKSIGAKTAYELMKQTKSSLKIS